ncbi:MAG: DUF6114 domain-containing protein [Candidatus Bathyarchaeota archaeon]|nr:DUF6114 domain-containing protein [Candidatus Bathyarchaeota archaeon]
MDEKPTAAFVLSLLGAIFIIIGGLVYAVVFSIIGGVFDFIGFGGLGGLITILGFLGIVWGVLVLIGAIMMNSEDKSKVRTGSILVLIFSILSWVGAAGGIFIGFLLGLIGGILGLTWNPSRYEAPPPPP